MSELNDTMYKGKVTVNKCGKGGVREKGREGEGGERSQRLSNN